MMAMDHNASIIKNADCLIHIMVWGMLAGFRRGNRLENLYLEDR